MLLPADLQHARELGIPVWNVLLALRQGIYDISQRKQALVDGSAFLEAHAFVVGALGPPAACSGTSS